MKPLPLQLEKRLKIYLLICFSFFGLNQSFGSHVIGYDFSYQYVSNNIYTINLKVYRDCSGQYMCGGTCTSTCAQYVKISGTGPFNGVNYGDFTLNLIPAQSGFDIIPLCSLSKTVCNNCGTRTAGTFAPGVEVYTFSGLVNLNSVPSSVCVVRITSQFSDRGANNISISTLIGFNGELLINRCNTINSSPKNSNNSVFVMCTGVDQSYNFAMPDPDGDSLSYSLAPSLANINTVVPYLPPFYATAPFPYLGFPFQGSPITLPIGIGIFQSSGDVMFRPIGNFLSNLVLETKQWKNISGTPTFMGSTRQEFLIKGGNCSENTLVVRKKHDSTGSFIGNIAYNIDSVRIEEGKPFCRIYVASDNTISDTTDFTWKNLSALSGATVTRLYNNSTRNLNGPRQDSIKFCWTPPTSAKRSLPYVFTMTATDRVCPMPASTVRSLVIYVKDRVQNQIHLSSYSNPKCVGESSGTISVYSTDGVAPIQFKLNNGSYQSSGVFNNLPAGNYKISTLDGAGHRDSLTLTLLNPYDKQVQLSILSTTPILGCINDSSGAISLGISNGISPFLFKQLGKDPQPSPVFTGLNPGTITLIVIDSNNCSDTVVGNINGPIIPLSGNLTLKNALCYSQNGSYTLTASGGVSPYLYSKNDGLNYDTLWSNVPIPAGSYQFKIKDNNNCLVSLQGSIQAPLQLSLNHLSTPIKCKGDSAGMILLSGSGGIPPYKYAINNGTYQSSPEFNHLLAGNYSVSILDSNNCELSIQNVFINEPAKKLSLEAVTKNTSCLGAKNGWAKISVQGGTKPYAYTWNTSPVQNTDSAILLSNETISLAIADSNTCRLDTFITIGYRPVYSNEVICAVTTDTALRVHRVIWNKTQGVGTDSYRIYGSTSSGSGFFILDTIPFNDDPIYYGNNTSHLGSIIYYKLHSVDSCGNESGASAVQSNTLLTGQKIGFINRLSWVNTYGPSGVNTIAIWRSINGAAFAQIASLAAGTSSYIDSILPAGNLTYFLEFNLNPNCTYWPSTFGKITSNSYIIPMANGLNESALYNQFQIYPNPSSGIISITSGSSKKEIETVEIYSAQGAKVFSQNYSNSQTIEINMSELATGIYHVKVLTKDNGSQSTKVVLTK